ncbi:MAG: PKD domain-containing protein [Sphingobacteriia bacterium]|nr:PKD domain-containing protein [Sphingobacteriia bacterium]
MKSFFTSLLVFVGIMFCLNPIVFGNGLVISNTALTGQNTTSQTWQVRFNLTWENSWRDNVNNDAVWVFCKWSTTTGVWNHATLNVSGFSTGTGTPLSIQVSCDRKGAMISRRDFGSGTLNSTTVELQWAYGTDGVSNGATPLLTIYGIEMVYIPGGPFTIGDGNGVNSSSSNSLYAVSQHLPYTIDDRMSPVISSSNFVNASGSPVNFLRIDGDNGLDLNCDGNIVTGQDSAMYPTGYLPFYIMKYEITQGQYCDFLNTLTYTQQSSRVQNSTNTPGQYAWDGLTAPTNRQTILVQTAGVNSTTPRVYSTARPDRACNYLNAMDGMAYTDWAALRPLTELEFEKACRGPLPPVLNDRPWGNTNYSCNSGATIVGNENGTESVTGLGLGYANPAVSQGDGGTGPVRVGILANNSTSTRSATGNTFYGVCNMGDNLNEYYISLNHVAGRSFRGDHGNGILVSAGHADVSNWPGASANSSNTTANSFSNTGSTATAGFGAKNNSSCNGLVISDRGSMTSNPSTGRNTSFGFRAGCSALSGDFTISYPNGGYAAVGTASSFFGPLMPVGTTYSWSFPSGTPASSTVVNPQVTWSSAGTYNATLTVTQGSCTATSIVAVPVIAACSSPSILSGTQSWTQSNTTYSNNTPYATNTSSYGPTRLFDGNTTAGSQSYWGYGGSCVTGAPMWVVVDFVSTTNLNGIGIYTYARPWHGNQYYDVDMVIIETGSSSTGPWTQVGLVTPAKDINAFQNLSFIPTSSRYWRFSFSNSQDCNMLINELRFNRCN